MTLRSSTRAGGRWRVPALLLALALALALTAAAAPSAHAGSANFCPASGTVNLGAGNGCTGPFAIVLQRVSFFQNSPNGTRCAVGKAGSDPDSPVVIVAVCGPGDTRTGEVSTTASVPPSGYPRGRNDTGVMQYSYHGTYYW
jgi:hypothetical protein